LHFRHLELFCRVAQVNSFSKAGKLLHLTQPAVSAQIQALEDYYETTFFDRTPQGVFLTPAGEVLYRYAKEMLALHRAMEKELADLSGTGQQVLRLGASTSIGSYALPCSLWAFREQFPEVQVKLHVGNASEVMQKLQAGELDLALLEHNPELSPNLAASKVSSDHLVVAAPPSCPWKNRPNITLKDLAQVPLLMREPGSGIRRALENQLERLGYSLDQFQIAAELGSIDAIKACVEKGAGLAILNREAVKKEVNQGHLLALVISELADPIDYYLVYSKHQFYSPVVKLFRRFICGPGSADFC